MNETEKERILRMVTDGTLRPNEAAQLLAALSEEPKPSEGKKEAKKEEAKPQEKAPEQLMEVQMQRPDGSTYTIQVPPNLFPMFWKIAKVAIKESARVASQEAWDGFKNMVRNKADEVKTSVTTRFTGEKTATVPAASPEQEQQSEARRRILQMVQNGRINAQDASRLIQQLDALQEYQKNTGK